MSEEERLEEVCSVLESDAVLFDGMERALVGVVEPCPGRRSLAVYDYWLMVELLVERDGMEVEEAQEFIDYNVVGLWAGEGTPVVVRRVGEV